VESKSSLGVLGLNTDGFNDHTRVDIEEVARTQDLDVICLLKTKFRAEDVDKKIKLEGFEVFEARRGDYNGDKAGGPGRRMVSFSSVSP
jgi:hypothetical protein